MHLNFVLGGYCASNILWLDLLKPVKFNYYYLRENNRVGRPKVIKKFVVDKTKVCHPVKAQFVINNRSRGHCGVQAYLSKAVFLQY